MHARTHTTNLRSRGKILLERTQVLSLLCWCLVSTVTELGRGVDPFEVDLLQCSPACVREHGFAESHNSLLHPRNRALKQDEVILDLTISNETTHAAFN
jgi:hypothetical protein